jgi:nucleotide-binding universal stress UspA family protein
MMTRLLVPLDGSETAEQVLPHARALARILKVPVELVTVIEIGPYVSTKKARYLDHLIDTAVGNSEAYLKRVARTFGSGGVKCTVEKGNAKEVIITKAAADRGTLVAMGTHGSSGLNRWLLGSVTERVARAASNPVLVVRAIEDAVAEGEAVPASIIASLDGSELAESVLPVVVELAKAFNLKVTLLRSYSLKDAILRFEDYTPDLDELKGELRWEAMSYLDEKVRQLKSEGLADVSPFVAEGDAAEIIIDSAKASPNSWVAVCTHGRSGIERWVLGSVTEKVLRHSNNPVLVIRTN